MTKMAETVQLGELVAAAFDEAALRSPDPREVSQLAARMVMQVLRRARPPTEAGTLKLFDVRWAAAEKLDR